MERETSCCFTGHRAIPAADVLWLSHRVREEILRAAEKGMTTFLAGGALGFDTLAEREVLRVRDEGEFPVRLVLALPCPGQEARWSKEDVEEYRALLKRADEVIYTGDAYVKGCMFRRNRYLVDHSALCICYYTGQPGGGTAYTVKYAEKNGVQVINLGE